MDKHGQIDMLHGPIWNKLPRFALPIAATAILEQLFNASDVAVVGNFTGGLKTIAVAAVGANSPVIGLVLNLFIGIALGVNVVIATAAGRGDAEAVRRTVHTAVTMSVVCGALIAAAGELAAPALLGMMNVPGEVLPHALTYLRIYLLGMPVILLYNFESAIFRSVGETAVPLRALFMSGILNVLLNFLFVIVFKMTVDGVAIATVIANAVSAAVLLRRLVRTDEVIAVGCMRLRIVFAAYAFTVLYEVMSGFLRGFGISLVPAVLTTLGVCGVRILWVAAVFPLDRTFKTVMLAYPASFAATALLMLAALLYYRPSRRFADRAHN